MNEELRRALDRAAGEDPVLDVSEQAWTQGRVVRRRRQVAQGVGGLAAAAVIVGAFTLGGGLAQPNAGIGPALPTVEDDATRSAPVHTYALPTPTPTPRPTTQAEEGSGDGPPADPPEQTITQPIPTSDPAATEPVDAPVPTAAPLPTTPPARTTPAVGTEPPVAAPTGTATSAPTPPVPTTQPPPSDPPTSEPPPSDPPTADCSASGMSGVVVPGDAPAVVTQKAQTLLDAAAACDQDALVGLATADVTRLSLGGQSPQEAFALPEVDGYDRYALVVQTLTAREPVVLGEGSEDSAFTWHLTEDERGWRIGITPDGTWSFFLAGD